MARNADADLDAAFRALASSRRREILRMLSDSTPQADKRCCGPEEICACKISERLGLSPSTISHHMSLLRKAGLITERKAGQWTYYTLQRDVLARVAQSMKDL